MDIKLQFTRVLILFIRSILFPSIAFAIILLVYVAGGKLTLDDLKEFMQVFLIIYFATVGFSYILLFEYLFFSLGKAVIVDKSNIQIYRFGKLYKSFNREEITKVVEYGETFKFHYFPWGSYRFADLIFKDDSRITVNSFQYRDIKKLFLDRYELKRNILPSITLYKIYRFFAERD